MDLCKTEDKQDDRRMTRLFQNQVLFKSHTPQPVQIYSGVRLVLLPGNPLKPQQRFGEDSQRKGRRKREISPRHPNLHLSLKNPGLLCKR